MTYGILLNSMGFDTSQLLYALVIADPKARDDREFNQKVIDAVEENGPKEGTLDVDSARIQVHKFNQEEAKRDLDWAIEFWKSSREPIPTKRPNKCRTCEYIEKRSAPH